MYVIEYAETPISHNYVILHLLLMCFPRILELNESWASMLLSKMEDYVDD